MLKFKLTPDKRYFQLIHNDLKKELGLSYLFISHDLALVSELADRLIVMYKGKIIEKGIASNIFSNPSENYTKGLLYSRPNNKVKLRKLPTVSDYINDSVNNSIIGEKEIEISRHKIYSNSPILKIKIFFRIGINFLKTFILLVISNLLYIRLIFPNLSPSTLFF